MKKPILTGHSLGGAIAQRLMVEDGIYDKVSKVVTFNSPTINRSATKKWNELVDAGLVRDDQAETVSVELDRLVNHRCGTPLTHLNSYFLGRKLRFHPEGLPRGKAHSGCVMSLGGTFELRERSDCGRSALKTVLVAFIHIIKAPIWLLLTVLSALIIEPIAFFAKTEDKRYRDLANRTVSLYSASLAFKYQREIKALGEIAKTDSAKRRKAVDQLVRFAQASSGKGMGTKHFFRIPEKAKGLSFYIDAVEALGRYAKLPGSSGDKAREQLVALCMTLEGKQPDPIDDDVVTISHYKLDMHNQMVIRHQIWKLRQEDLAGNLYSASVEVLGPDLASFLY